MHIKVSFCQKFVRTHVSHAKTVQSTELSQRVKQSAVLATVKREELVFWTPRFFLFLDSTLFRFAATFWLDSTLKLYYNIKLNTINIKLDYTMMIRYHVLICRLSTCC